MRYEILLWDAKIGLWNPGWDMRYGVGAMRYEIWDMGYEIWDTRYKIWDTRYWYEMRNLGYDTRDMRYEIRDMKYEIWDTRYEIQGTRHQIWDGVRDTTYEVRGWRASCGIQCIWYEAWVVRYEIGHSMWDRSWRLKLAPVSAPLKNKSRNTGWTSVDRSTRTTLSTYNTWIWLGRLQKIYQSRSTKLWVAK